MPVCLMCAAGAGSCSAIYHMYQPVLFGWTRSDFAGTAGSRKALPHAWHAPLVLFLRNAALHAEATSPRQRLAIGTSMQAWCRPQMALAACNTHYEHLQ